jgi:hypothetical protein
MLNTIEIQISNGIINKISCLIIYKKNICYINDKQYQITDKQLAEIKDLLVLWKNEYGVSSNIDDEEFLITVLTPTTKTTYHGKGYYPKDYHKLKEILGEIYD